MRYRAGILIALTSATVAWAVACGSDDVTTPSLPPQVQDLRDALGAYTSLALAKNAGYGSAITDCMSNGDQGAMGIHYGNTTLFDATVDALHPEVLIYEPGTDGQASLVGVEFLVPYSALPKTAPAPQLFGQSFAQNDIFGVWALHVWTHRTNPSGTFAPWNPRVHC